jgi:hypothetical protein
MTSSLRKSCRDAASTAHINRLGRTLNELSTVFDQVDDSVLEASPAGWVPQYPEWL